MIFSTIILVLVGLIAFFHYVQGFFSATLSAVIAVVAAVMALSYHEVLAERMLGGRFADQAHAIALVVLFAAIYLVLRIIFDYLIPGNVRLPASVDKVGAAVMGIIAAVFATGVLAVAAQTLPFGPSIAQYSRYQLRDQGAATIPVRGTPMRDDAFVFHELMGDSFEEAEPQSMFLPVDDILVGMVAHLSEGGSLAGRQPLERVHPSYLDQLFAQRIALEPGAVRTALNIGPHRHVRVEALYELDSLRQIDAELDTVRPRSVPETLEPAADEVLVVVRAMFDINASDPEDGLFRFSPAAVRLVAGQRGQRENYHPVGSLEFDGQGRPVLLANKPDDPLFVDVRTEERGADLVFVVNERDLVATTVVDPEAPGRPVANNVFLEVKRMARVDLSGQTIEPRIAPSEQVRVLRKPMVMARLAPPEEDDEEDEG